MYVYADNAATTKLSKVALDAMIPYFETVYGNPSSLHSAGQAAKEALEDARARVAACLGCEPREIYFTSGGSEADNQASFPLPGTGKERTKNTLFPQPLSITRFCTLCRSWKKKASRLPIWM